MRSGFFVALLAVGACLGACPAVLAQSYPNKPLRLIIPFPPGGGADSVSRVVAQRLSVALGQNVLLDNRPGAGTIIATDLGAKAAPDGYTLLLITAAFTANPSLHRKLPYDSVRHLKPVTQLSAAPNILVVHPSVPAASVTELIAYAKAHPNALNFGSAGNGTSNHFAGEMFRTMAQISAVHVPYKGTAPSITDLIAGRIQLLFIGLAPVEPHIKTGRLRALAVASAKPSAVVPGLPTVASSGLSNFESTVWNGIAAPAATPNTIVERLHTEIVRVLAQPDTRQKILAMGFEPVGSSPAEFAQYVRGEMDRAARLVAEVGIRAE
ncbi:MAG TPA: tripartite tricarboxylate transporter substrate binding protein [Burkholderiales bacterium]|nr:tripartite tricarboxylate transporter substrate binding protein [Burkholderiales bacterium]